MLAEFEFYNHPEEMWSRFLYWQFKRNLKLLAIHLAMKVSLRAGYIDDKKYALRYLQEVDSIRNQNKCNPLKMYYSGSYDETMALVWE